MTLQDQVPCLCHQNHTTHSLPGSIWLTAYHPPCRELSPFCLCLLRISTNSIRNFFPATRTQHRYLLIQEVLPHTIAESGAPLSSLLVDFIYQKVSPRTAKGSCHCFHEMRIRTGPTLHRIVMRVK